tara:strand:+ start:1192 stop:1386 length:195 start_codon:yes stop_codon:yes gene_type:complete
MKTYKITEARNKQHIGKLINVENGKTIFNKKNYYVGNENWNGETDLYLETLRPTSPIWVKLSEI